MYYASPCQKELIKLKQPSDRFEAEAKIMSFKHDAILLDLCMHGMDGFQACRKAKENPTTVP